MIYSTLLVCPCILVPLILYPFSATIKVNDGSPGDGCREALWLPYRKDRAQLKEAIEEAGPVKAVFAHADVVCYAPIFCSKF